MIDVYAGVTIKFWDMRGGLVYEHVDLDERG